MEVLAEGSQFRHLQIERELGRGAFARVFLAQDALLGRDVALKVFSTTGRSVAAVEVERFLAEARLIARLQSPHVVTLFQLHEVPTAGAMSFMLEMEFVPGGTLAEAADSGLTPEQADAYLRGILRGLGAAHEAGVLHRDVKPANILISARSEAKLTDFGLARMIGEEIDLDDGVFGTPLYMAPELLVGGSASEQSDLWSVGVVAYRVLAGRLPFPSGDPAAFFAAMQNEEPAPLPPLIPAHLRALVTHCLQKDPAQRPASCVDLLALLDRPPVELAAPAVEPTLHGRGAELARIEAALERTGTLLVTGAAGIGKTALCAEAARRAQGRGVLWIDARLSAIEGPFTTLIDAARAAALADSDPASTAFGPSSARLKHILRGAEPPALDSPQQALWTLQGLFTGIATTRPLVLCVDDAHHATEEDVAFLADLARWLLDRPFALIVASRPDAPATARLGESDRLALGGLEREALFALLEDRIDAALPARIVDEIFRRTDGNPLRALELARHLEETGALLRRDGRLEATANWRDTPVPARLRDVVHARLASFDEPDRALLEVAAVDGREFDGGALAHVLGLPVLQVLQQLQRLCRERTLIAPAPRGYRFADTPTQEVLYEDMAPELRQELHRALARHLEERADDADARRLARHWERSGERARAAPYLLLVAERAKSRQEIRRFADLAERAGMLEDPPLVDLRRERELAQSLAATLMRRGRAEESEALYARLFRTAEDDATRTRIEVHRATALLLAGKRPERDAAYWSACADRFGETTDAGHARAIVGKLLKLNGDLDAAMAAFEEADRIFLALGDEWNHAIVLDQLGSVAMRANDLATARARYAEAARVAEGAGLATNAAVSRTNAALARMMDGRIDGIDRELAHSIRTFELAGSFGHAAHTRIYLAEALLAEGRTGAALETLEGALPVLERAGHQAALTNAWRMRAELHAIQGDLVEAAHAIAQALEYGSTAGDAAQLLVAHAADAMIATVQGRQQDAARAVAAVQAGGAAHADGAVLLLCEAVLFGMPHSQLEAAGDLARNDHERDLRDATLGFAQGSDFAAPLRALDAAAAGLRRASYRLLTDWLAAESAHRSGNADEAKKRIAAALETAATLGHTRAEAKLRAASDKF